MDTPYEVPEPLWSWRRVAAAEPGTTVTQGPARRYRSTGFDDYAQEPTVSHYTLDSPGGWWLLDERPDDLTVEGRLVGGCLETVANLAGTPYGSITQFAETHAPGGTLVYLEACEVNAFEVGRRLHGMRLAGWFDHANGVLIGRTQAPDAAGYTQVDAVRDALGPLGIPVVMDVDCGHVPPHLALVNGASATVTRADGEWSLRQVLD